MRQRKSNMGALLENWAMAYKETHGCVLEFQSITSMATTGMYEAAGDDDQTIMNTLWYVYTGPSPLSRTSLKAWHPSPT